MPKSIIEIYKDYKIFPNLQMHMLRVGAVASLICDNMLEPVDKQKIVLTCLLHDMGNIIKTRMDVLPEYFEPEGVEYWQKVKDEFVAKYGADDNQANVLIARELGLEAVAEMINCFGFANSEKNFQSGDMNTKIAFYADQRVAPHGVVSFLGRVEDAKKRYAGRTLDLIELGEEKIVGLVLGIENQMFSKCKIKPEDITDQDIAPIIEELKGFMVYGE